MNSITDLLDLEDEDIFIDNVNLHSEIKCGVPPTITECSAIRCVDFTIHLTSLQYCTPPRPTLRQKGRKTTFSVSGTIGLPMSIDYVPAALFITQIYDSLPQNDSLLILAVHNKVLCHTIFLFHQI